MTKRTKKSPQEKAAAWKVIERSQDPWGDDFGMDRGEERTLTGDALLRLIDEALGEMPGDERAYPKTLAECTELLRDAFGWCDHNPHYLTEQEAAEEAKAERTAKLEALAKAISKACNKPTDSLEFIAEVERRVRSVQEERNDFSYENAAEYMMDCVHACGSVRGAEVYAQDMAYQSGLWNDREENLEGVLEWLAAECPLLWAKHQEAKLKAAASPVSRDEEE